MNNNNNNTNQLDGLAKGGAIVSIVLGSFGLVLFGIMSLLVLGRTYSEFGSVSRAAGIVYLIFSLMSLIGLIFNILFLSKKTDKLRVTAGVLSILSISLIGGILTLCGKVIAPKNQNPNNPDIDESMVTSLGIE